MNPVRSRLALMLKGPNRCRGPVRPPEWPIFAAEWLAWPRLPSAETLEVEDLAVLRDEVRCAARVARKRTVQVDVHDQVPVVLGHLEQQVVARDAGVVDEHVDAPEPETTRLGLGGLGGADVAADPDGLRASVSGSFAAVSAALAFVEVEDGDRRAPPRRTASRSLKPMPRAAR